MSKSVAAGRRQVVLTSDRAAMRSALVLARPGHQREEERGAGGDRDRGYLLHNIHVNQSRADDPSRHQDHLKPS